MPGINTPITDREKAAILALIMGVIPDAKTAYMIADKKGAENQTETSLKSMISRWTRSQKYKSFADYVTRLLADRETDARRRGREEAERSFYNNGDQDGRSERTDKPQKTQIDFYDPKNQRKQINRIIQEAADDPRTQLDAIKAIQQTQRDDRQAAKDNQIQRFYLPIRCAGCPLYQKAQKKATK